MLQSNSFVSVIDKPTRVTLTSKTLIDLLITNNTEKILSPSVIHYSISDHFPIVCSLSDEINKHKQSNKCVFIRDTKNIDEDKFREDLYNSLNLININANNVLTEENYNNKFDEFIKVIQLTINKHAPLRELSESKQNYFINLG